MFIIIMKTIVAVLIINNFVLIQEIEQKEKTTAAGVIIPIEKYNRESIVINAGDVSHIKVGDTVVKNIGKGTEVKLNNEAFELIHINQLFGVFKEES